MLKLFNKEAKIEQDVFILAVIPFAKETAPLFGGIFKEQYFTPEQYVKFGEAAKFLRPVHDDKPFSYPSETGTSVRYLWVDLDHYAADNDKGNPAAHMVQMQGDVVNGVIDKDSLIMLHGEAFMGAVVYKRQCCGKPSIALVGFQPGVTTVLDSLDNMQDEMRQFFADRVFPADEGDKSGMLHALVDAQGNCATHDQNVRAKSPRLAL